jgi:hypothetical protein
MRIESRRTRLALLILGCAALTAGSAAAHDLFLKLDTYFLPPNTPVRVTILNGTFTTSEGIVARDRIADISLVGPAGTQALDTGVVTARAKSSELRLRTGAEGTYVLGLSIRPREIALTGRQFNEYLQEEGIEDVLAERTRTGTLGEPAKERYAKHVKSVFQVGKARTESAVATLGYAAEIVPLENPYGLTRGKGLSVRCLIDGQPVGNLVVIAGGIGPKGGAIKEIRVRTGADGIARLPLGAPGRWYAKFVRMHRSTLPGINYESQWATLTLEVR